MENKSRGEIAEIRFFLKMSELGYTVSIPLGDTAQYDTIVDTGTRRLRVQIKSTRIKETTYRHSRFRITAGHGRINTPYSISECDILAMYIEPENIWYIAPIEDIQSASIGLYPHNNKSRGKYEVYKERWDFLA